MIVRYGEKVMCNVTNEEGQEIPVSVIEYVVSDLKQDELSFHNPLHRQILTEAAAQYMTPDLQPNVIFWLIRTLPSAN